MKHTYETSTLHLDENAYNNNLRAHMGGNDQLTSCDTAGEKDPMVAVYITPEGDFKISDTIYEYSSSDHSYLSHTVGGLILNNLPTETVPQTNVRQLRSVA